MRLAAVFAILAAAALGGCAGPFPDVPNTGDAEVEVIVSTLRPEPHWYDVAVYAQEGPVLLANVTLAGGERELGDLPAGSYLVSARNSAGESASLPVQVDTRHVIYVTHLVGYPMSISVSTLGE